MVKNCQHLIIERRRFMGQHKLTNKSNLYSNLAFVFFHQKNNVRVFIRDNMVLTVLVVLTHEIYR